MKNPGIAAVLSFFLSGLGQIYNGQITKGLLIILVQIINGVLTLVLIGWVFMFLVWLWALYDAYAVAVRINERGMA